MYIQLEFLMYLQCCCSSSILEDTGEQERRDVSVLTDEWANDERKDKLKGEVEALPN